MGEVATEKGGRKAGINFVKPQSRGLGWGGGGGGGGWGGGCFGGGGGGGGGGETARLTGNILD